MSKYLSCFLSEILGWVNKIFYEKERYLGTTAKNTVNLPNFLVCPKSPETMRRLCLSTTFKLQKIKWNYSVNLRFQSEYRKMRTRNNFAFGRFSRSVINAFFGFYYEKIDKKYFDLMLDTLNDNHKENLNSIQEFIIIKSWLLLSFLMCLSHIKEYRCLNNVFTI